MQEYFVVEARLGKVKGRNAYLVETAIRPKNEVNEKVVEWKGFVKHFLNYSATCDIEVPRIYLTHKVLKVNAVYAIHVDEKERIDYKNKNWDDYYYYLVNTPENVRKKEVNYYKLSSFFGDGIYGKDQECLYEECITEIRVYNVKHGNVNALITNKSNVMLFDFGSRTHASNLLQAPNFNNLNPDNVKELVISHHHTDHYTYLSKILFPNLKRFHIIDGYLVKISLAKTINRYVNKTVITIHMNSNQLVGVSPVNTFSNCIFHTTSVNNSNINENSIMMTIKLDNKGEIKILPADTSESHINFLYSSLHTQNERFKHISMVAPHHGGDIRTSKSGLQLNGNNCIISCEPFIYNMPNKETIVNLLGSGFRTQGVWSQRLHNYLIL